MGYAIRCIILQREAYEGVVKDHLMTGPALLIALVSILVTNLVRDGGFDATHFVVAIGMWFLAVALVFAAGWVLTKRGNFTRTLRAVGFAHAVYFLSVFALFRAAAPAIQFAVFALGFLATWMGVATAHKTTGWRTLLLPVVVLLIYVIGTAVFAHFSERRPVHLPGGDGGYRLAAVVVKRYVLRVTCCVLLHATRNT